MIKPSGSMQCKLPLQFIGPLYFFSTSKLNKGTAAANYGGEHIVVGIVNTYQ